MFRSLPVAVVRVRASALPLSTAGFRRDTITLGWEDRLKARARRASDQGFEFATTLDRGVALTAGDVFVFDAERIIVEVLERLEAVFVIRPQTPEEWATYAYHIGNNHQPVMLAADGLVCAELPGMEQMLVYHAIPFAREQRAFTPIARIPDHLHAIRA